MSASSRVLIQILTRKYGKNKFLSVKDTIKNINKSLNTYLNLLTSYLLTFSYIFCTHVLFPVTYLVQQYTPLKLFIKPELICALLKHCLLNSSHKFTRSILPMNYICCLQLWQSSILCELKFTCVSTCVFCSTCVNFVLLMFPR